MNIIFLLALICFFSCQDDHVPLEEIENRIWVLEQIKENETGKIQMIAEYHFLELRDEQIQFSIDCNRCSRSYHFVGGDSISIDGLLNCTRKNCIEKDSVQINYYGKYKMWIEGSKLMMRNTNKEYVYK